MRFFSARLNFDNGIVLKFDGFLVNLFQYKTNLVKGGKGKPSRRKTAEKSGKVIAVKSLCAVNTCKSKPSHLKILRIRQKNSSCERVNAVLADKNTYHIEIVFLIVFSCVFVFIITFATNLNLV